MNLRTSEEGLDLIREYEGLRLESYPDPGTGAEPWTIGYGHTGDDVFPRMRITRTEADALLRGDDIRDSGNTTVTDSQNGDHAGRDLIGRDRIDNTGNFGTDNRQGSDGPIDDHSDPGDDCTGSDCSETPPPATGEAP